MLALARRREAHERAGEGGDGGAGRRVFANAPARREHARAIIDALAARRVTEDRGAAVGAPVAAVGIDAAERLDAGDRGEQEFDAGVELRRQMRAKADLGRRKAQASGDVLDRRRRAAALRAGGAG